MITIVISVVGVLVGALAVIGIVEYITYVLKDEE